MEEKKIFYCAVYTRKSHEDGLEQEFNSLDAQREAAENYIASQKMNGWQLLPEHYDDGGFSGGNMDRPALKQLLADVETGKIQIIVVYKLDRLSRSLLDFMRLAEMLERHNVSFVSVTQDINTSTSAGRMMLNILMTFAQYEREVIAERIRDKVAGAKRRGKYCGGTPLLGYYPDAMKKLIIVEKEAEVVRFIFRRYSEIRSVKRVLKELNEKGYKTKTWTSKKGNLHEGDNFDTGDIYRMLNNPTYIGKVTHKDKIFPGEHEAIISEELWEKVHKALTLYSRSSIKNSTSNPLKGLVHCGYCDGAMTCTYSSKKERRYMYFQCVKDTKRAESTCPLKTVPAGDLERVVLQQLASLFRTPSILIKTYEEVHEKEKAEVEFLLQKQKELLAKVAPIRNEVLKIMGEEKSQEKGAPSQIEFIQLSKEILEVKNQLEFFKTTAINKADIIEALDNIQSIWAELFPGEKQRLIYLLIEKITVLKESLKIELKIDGMTSLVSDIVNIQMGSKQ